jgi:hypothetical protein
MGLNFWLTFALNTASAALQAYLLEARPEMVPVVQKLISDIQNLLAVIHTPKPPAV